MKPDLTRLLPLLAATILSSGCASIWYPSHDELLVVTDPPGATATCEGARVVTPGSLRISRRKSDAVVVRVDLEGYESRQIEVERRHEIPTKPWGVPLAGAVVGGLAAEGCDSIGYVDCTETVGAVSAAMVVVAMAGIAVDQASPRTYALTRTQVVLRLEPVRPRLAQEGELR